MTSPLQIYLDLAQVCRLMKRHLAIISTVFFAALFAQFLKFVLRIKDYADMSNEILRKRPRIFSLGQKILLLLAHILFSCIVILKELGHLGVIVVGVFYCWIRPISEGAFVIMQFRFRGLEKSVESMMMFPSVAVSVPLIFDIYFKKNFKDGQRASCSL